MLEAHTNCRLLPSSYFQPSSAAITVISVRFLSQTLVDASLFHYFAPNSVLLSPGKEGRKFPRRRNLPLKYEAEVPILWPPDVNSWLIGKDPDAGKDWRHKEKRVTEDEMVGWHHQFNGRELGQTPEDDEGQGSLAYCSPWDTNSWTWVGDWTTITTIYWRLLSCAGLKEVILLLQHRLNVQLGNRNSMTRNTQLLTWCLSKTNSHLVLMPWCLVPGSTFTPQVCVTHFSLSRNLKSHLG